MADFRVIIKSLIDNRTAYKNLADLKKNVQRTSREISKLDTQQANLGTKRSKLVQQLEEAKRRRRRPRPRWKTQAMRITPSFTRCAQDCEITSSIKR